MIVIHQLSTDMPNPTKTIHSTVYSKNIPSHIAWSKHVEYTFPSKDLTRSTDEVQCYRLPSRNQTFWFNFRVVSYSEKGILHTTPLSIDLYVITADQQVYSLVSGRHYHPNRWYSMCWPIPAIHTTEDSGVYLGIKVASTLRLRVDLQGFEYAQPFSHHYVMIDEQDRQRFLFKHEESVRRGRIETRSIGSIHEIEEEVEPTQGLDSQQIDGIPLFPMNRQEVVSWTET